MTYRPTQGQSDGEKDELSPQMKQTSGYNLYLIFQYHISYPYVLFINVVALISGSKEGGIHQLNMLLVKLPAHIYMVPNLSRRCLEFLAYYEPENRLFLFSLLHQISQENWIW